MLNNLLFKTLRDEKDPDKRMWQIILIIVVPILFWMVVNGLSGNNKDCKAENIALKNEIISLKADKKNDERTIDSLKDANYNDKINFIIEKDRYSKTLDSLIFNLQQQIK